MGNLGLYIHMYVYIHTLWVYIGFRDITLIINDEEPHGVCRV